MKSKDIQIIILVAVISAIMSLLLSGVFFSTPEDRAQTVETAEPIVTDFQRPTSDYFNAQSINPAQDIEIGQDPDSNPFQGR